jgi:predicted transcriptional regulator
MSDRRAPGPLETAVMSVVAAASAPVAVAEVQKKLPGEPAYTTVMTTLSRLAEKGALTQSREGRAYRYSLAAPPEAVDDAVTARRMRRLLNDGSDRAGVLARFVAELDPEEERLLADLLDRSDHKAG